MSLIQIKCNNCGANLNIDETTENYKCDYCGTPYVKPKEETKSNVVIDIINAIKPKPIPVNPNGVRPPRPKISAGLAVLGFIFYIFPGIIYIAYKKHKQYEWDCKYGNN